MAIRSTVASRQRCVLGIGCALDVVRITLLPEAPVSSAKRGRAGLYRKDRLLRETKETTTMMTVAEVSPCEVVIGCATDAVRTTLLPEARASSARNKCFALNNAGAALFATVKKYKRVCTT
jgi:hypothetical protein